MSDKNPLLIDSKSILIVIPELAIALGGLNEAIVLQQIYYWININKEADRNFYDGRYWTYNTYEEWQEQFPFWCTRTIRRALNNLEDKGILIIGNFNKKGYDKTRWYSINHENLDKLLESAKNIENAHVDKMTSPCGQNDQSMWTKSPYPCGQNDHTNTIDYPYNSSKTSPEISDYMVRNSNEISNDVDEPFDYNILNLQIRVCYNMLLREKGSLSYSLVDYIEVFTYFYQSYEEYTGHSHPKIGDKLIKKVMEDMPYIQGGNADGEDVDVGANKTMIDAYFKQPWGNDINPTIMHFMSGNIRSLRWYEKCYRL